MKIRYFESHNETKHRNHNENHLILTEKSERFLKTAIGVQMVTRRAAAALKGLSSIEVRIQRKTPYNVYPLRLKESRSNPRPRQTFNGKDIPRYIFRNRTLVHTRTALQILLQY